LAQLKPAHFKYHSINLGHHSCHDWINSIDSDYISCLKKNDSEFIIGWDSLASITIPTCSYDASLLDAFINANQGYYIFGFLSYDIKDVHTRELIRKDKITFPDLVLFVAKKVMINKGQTGLFYGEKEDAQHLKKPKTNHAQDNTITKYELTRNIEKETYLDHVQQIKELIQNGDFYELNYCIEYSGDLINHNTNGLFNRLMEATKAPFSAYFASPTCNILSGSPERYINRKRNTIMSQPIKGTAKRGNTPDADQKIAQTLVNDEKELAENVMIVDLVRNDLSKIAQKDSVEVPELCKLYSFKTVHQLISTVQCRVKDNTSFSQIIDATFPMGSMTGAPKINAIKYASAFENFNRGIYSGTVGMIEPNGNFDFNVVIRSIVANKKDSSLHVGIGGAITIQSDPEKEFEECNIKYEAIRKVLNA